MFLAPEKESIGLIQGVMPDSKEEWWTAQALWYYKIPFMFQYEIFGGRDRRGGLIVDFLVWNPSATPLLVHGNYWHKGELTGGDRTALVAIEQFFKKEPIIMWADSVQSKENVFAFVRKNVAK